VLENGEVEKVVLALYCLGLVLVFVVVVDLALKEVVGLLLAFAKDVGFHLLGLLLAALLVAVLALAGLFFGGDVEEAFDFHVGEDLVSGEGVCDSQSAEDIVAFPGEEEVVGGEHFELVLDELLHPLDFVELAFEFDVVAHQ
jgi:hypothetical protein